MIQKAEFEKLQFGDKLAQITERCSIMVCRTC